MSRRRKNAQPPEHPIEAELRKPQTIGSLEVLAGIDRSEAGRKAFWERFRTITPAGASLDAGCAELRRLAREKAGLLPQGSIGAQT
ncbi:hypothetical protein [Microvirga tunisiensis]|uniref:Uncharacterized protein n=1 Tax=Microvirga tunisiensis TaxID=2108360 RepID=A0A5N7MV82_9HYPH|nr:hypothetical protein [Microvirga tunisiensis]MPR12964.1 hypothetical protein [Microvirga tunisiensis]MPR30892.1 hypothetical protein [Microvirga tunisiensis]